MRATINNAATAIQTQGLATGWDCWDHPGPRPSGPDTQERVVQNRSRRFCRTRCVRPHTPAPKFKKDLKTGPF
jgi:hypothetical protein